MEIYVYIKHKLKLQKHVTGEIKHLKNTDERTQQRLKTKRKFSFQQ